MINNGAGVAFALGGSPPDMPGGTNVGFVSDFRVGANSPAPTNGLNPGETLSLVFNLNSSTFTDVINALNSGALRVGLHVISIGTAATSSSFVTVPEPSVGLLLG